METFFGFTSFNAPGTNYRYDVASDPARICSETKVAIAETRAGHGAGKPIDKIIEGTADMRAFAARWTGLVVKAAARSRNTKSCRRSLSSPRLCGSWRQSLTVAPCATCVSRSTRGN